jgi:competence/damage-inducible protein CinA-like protein
MKPQVEIFSQGEEVISGQTVDSNAAWLSQKLVQMGFVVKRHTAVGDNLPDLKNLLTEISTRADCCICTGGLGPTVDDLTAQAVAEAFDRPLQFDPLALAQIAHYFACRKREMVETNRKQAFFPQGSERIDNEWGTAPGFSLQQNRCWFAFVPGVPFEMKHLFDESIAKILLQRFSLQPDQLVTLRTVGIGESDIQQKLNAVTLPDNVQLSFRAAIDEVQTKLLFPSNTDQQQVKACVNRIADSIGDYVFAIDGPDRPQGGLVDVIGELMQQKQLTFSVQETASQGLIAAKCIGQPWLVSSFFSHTKTAIEMSADDCLNTAAKTARKLQQREKTDLTLVQLYQGSAEQFQQKDHSIVLYNVLLTPDGDRHSERTVSGPQQRKQNQATMLALDLLRRYLQNKCL